MKKEGIERTTRKELSLKFCRNDRQAILESLYEMNMVVFEGVKIGASLILEVIRSYYNLKILAIPIIFSNPIKDKLGTCERAFNSNISQYRRGINIGYSSSSMNPLLMAQRMGVNTSFF